MRPLIYHFCVFSSEAAWLNCGSNKPRCRDGHSPGRLASSPWPGGKGRNTTIALVSPGGRRSLEGGPQKKCRELRKAHSPRPASCNSEFRSRGGAAGWAAVLPASLSLSAEPGFLFGWSRLQAAVCGLLDTFTCPSPSPVSGGLSPINSNL